MDLSGVGWHQARKKMGHQIGVPRHSAVDRAGHKGRSAWLSGWTCRVWGRWDLAGQGRRRLEGWWTRRAWARGARLGKGAGRGVGVVDLSGVD